VKRSIGGEKDSFILLRKLAFLLSDQLENRTLNEKINSPKNPVQRKEGQQKEKDLSKFRALFFVTVCLVLFVGSLAAQRPIGRIIGEVKDDEGTPLPGVTVEAASPKLVGKSSVITDENGIYRLLALPPGTYTIKYSLPGFRPVTRQDIILRVEETITIDIAMTPGAIEEEITVIGQSPLIDVKSTYKGMTMDAEMFTKLPRGRNFDTLVTAVSGVSNEPWLGGISVDGASGAENMYYMDGTDITNLVRGTRAQSAAFEFVDEIQIKASGYAAEYGGAMGGVISVITRSGGNEFHGELIGFYSGSKLNSKERDTLRLKPEDVNQAEYVNYQDMYGKDTVHRYEVGFSLGGYILRDRLWFFGSFLPVFQDTTRHVTFTVNDEKRDSPQERRWYNFQGKLTAQPIGNLRLSASFVNNFSKYKGDLPPRSGAGNPDTDYAAYGFSYPNWSTSGSADITLGNNFLIGLRGGYFNYNTTDQLVTAATPWWRFQSETGGYPLTSNRQFNEARLWRQKNRSEPKDMSMRISTCLRIWLASIPGKPVFNGFANWKTLMSQTLNPLSTWHGIGPTSWVDRL